VAWANASKNLSSYNAEQSLAPYHRRGVVGGPAICARSGRASIALFNRRCGVRGRVHGPQYPRRQYRPRLVRPWRLVRTRRLDCSLEPALMVSGISQFPRIVRTCFRGSVRRAVWRTDLAAARRLFLVTDAGSDRAALCHWLPLDRIHWRRKRTRRGHARDGTRDRPLARRPLLLGSCRRCDGRLFPAVALSSVAGWQRTSSNP